MAAFGVPRVAEDDAIRAIRAGVTMQHAFRALAAEQSAAVRNIGLRVAVNTGEVVVSSDNTDVVGDPVNFRRRVRVNAATAAPGTTARPQLGQERARLAPHDSQKRRSASFGA